VAVRDVEVGEHGVRRGPSAERVKPPPVAVVALDLDPVERPVARGRLEQERWCGRKERRATNLRVQQSPRAEGDVADDLPLAPQARGRGQEAVELVAGVKLGRYFR